LLEGGARKDTIATPPNGTERQRIHVGEKHATDPKGTVERFKIGGEKLRAQLGNGSGKVSTDQKRFHQNHESISPGKEAWKKIESGF